MTNDQTARDFLVAMRSRLTPEQVGLKTPSLHRRVAGLRREEVALLAGVSVDYYTKLERGKLSGASDSVLNGLATALRLGAEERKYLFALASTRVARNDVDTPTVSKETLVSLQVMMDQMPNVLSYVRNNRLDVFAANSKAREVFDWMDSDDSYPNIAKFVFLDERAKHYFPAWDIGAHDSASILRMHVASYPNDLAAQELVTELRAKSPEFRKLWAAQALTKKQVGSKRFNTTSHGEVEFQFFALNVLESPELTMLCYFTEPGSQTHQKLFG